MEKKTSSFVIGTSISGRSPLPYGKRSDTLLEKRDGAACECIRDGGDRLIVSYSLARAANDAKNREKGVERLRKSYSSGMLTKANVNEHGYNKFLEIRGGRGSLHQSGDDSRGRALGRLEGICYQYCPAPEVIGQYHGLWVVERAFRISKGNLEMRPIFHFTERRIEGG